ncbi:hypothetical protein FZI91_21810 [Mycobacterium sp. CBMA271]|uniref:hypothetical protein n=1 Tax=unclassified Mycobacteroides TaxID=2618759 RepID=UPI0012DEFB84|nr:MULTISPECIES: hypothetical protein [unclassified Mycobacteroides]MUM19716.1 hypothetical protein [Mycobacteroides sp. CBMA 326]MUM24320.1 hypothetical protein [Mycobacteroides sp. CBMA 271]
MGTERVQAYVQSARDLYGRIGAGEWSVGMLLPSAAALRDEYAWANAGSRLSGTDIRLALAQLQVQGLISAVDSPDIRVRRVPGPSEEAPEAPLFYSRQLAAIHLVEPIALPIFHSAAPDLGRIPATYLSPDYVTFCEADTALLLGAAEDAAEDDGKHWQLVAGRYASMADVAEGRFDDLRLGDYPLKLLRSTDNQDYTDVLFNDLDVLHAEASSVRVDSGWATFDVRILRIMWAPKLTSIQAETFVREPSRYVSLRERRLILPATAVRAIVYV